MFLRGATKRKAAWKAAKALIEERNDEARKAGRAQRAAADLRVIEQRRLADQRERAELARKPR